jgi:TonB-linked SusC/RagA family outer membrane protein
MIHFQLNLIHYFMKHLIYCILLFWAVAIPATAGNTAVRQVPKSIQGIIVDEKEIPVIGASVVVPDASAGTVTDADGKFQLNLPGGKTTLEVSYLGYETKIVDVAGQTQVTIRLQPQSVDIDEVVVIGYGTVRKRDLTGAVVSVKSEDITSSPTSDVMEALQGKISGMDITMPGGQLGSDANLLLRGNRSIYGGNAPLFVIDGIPGYEYSHINPADVERMDILKDASSTAIYGTAGANGIIIITTKRAKENKATVHFDAYYGFSGEPEFFHGMTGDEWTNYQKEAYKYLNGQYPADMSAILTNSDKLNYYNQGKWIDWVEEASGNTAVNQKYNLSVTGGTDKTKVFASFSYNDQTGLLANESMKRYNLRLNVDREIFSWAKIGVTSSIGYTIGNNGVKNTFTKALSAFPLGEAYDDSGDIIYEFAPNEYTPLGDFIKNQFVNNRRRTTVKANAYLELTPVKNITFKSILGTSLLNSRLGQYWGKEANALRPTYAGTPHAEITNEYGWSYTWDNILTYSQTFNNDHTVGATLVSTWTYGATETNKAAGSGQNLDSWSFYRLMAATAPHVESDYSQSQQMSYAIRFNYGFRGKYLLTFSNRWDGVSWLSPGHKWDSFPAGALAWRISDEAFMENTRNWLGNLKIRAGLGITGNSGGIQPYSAQTKAYAYSGSGISIDGRIVPFTQYTETYGNPGLDWEYSYGKNIGLDFAVLNNRIDGSIEWFTARTNRLLFKRIMPISAGITGWGAPLASWENLAETSNRGFEMNINSRNIRNKHFSWNTTFSFSYGTEKIESLPSGDIIAENLFAGYPIKSMYSYKYTGIWGTDTPAETLAAYGVKPGWIQIETLPQDGDGGVHKYSDKDRQILGHSNPDFIAGLNNQFSCRNFDLALFAMARYGQTIQSGLLGWYNAKTGDSNNQIAGADYWTENNQGAYYPVPGSGNEQSAFMPALTFRDGSYIKLKNATLGYQIPSKISRKAKMEKLRVYATAYNLFVYTKDKQLRGTDPETNGSDSFPLYKQFVLGVNITF